MAIAMTFDDGPDPTTTPLLLDLLDKLEIKATFFVVGKKVDADRKILTRIGDSRHEVGNHSWSHTSFACLSGTKIVAELKKTHTLITDVIGTWRTPMIMRPPYGAITAKQKKLIAESLDYRIVGWNVDPEDWKEQKPETIVKRILDATKDTYTVLCHDVHERTIEAMRTVLPELKSKFTLVTVSQLGSYTQRGMGPAGCKT
jgi:peptidoglycan/xylan/chitin deacetylase (PgdA/CDA1 family)